MTDSTWSAADDAHAAISGYGPEEPLLTAFTFLQGIDNRLSRDEMSATVTPESIDAWGDFSVIRDALAEIGDWGVGSYPEPAPTASDVAYVKILANVPEVYQQQETASVAIAAWITLVWRPEAGIWLVHAFGNALDPTDVPRSSPGVAPDYTRAGR